MSAGPIRTLCLGDALVDLVGERRGRSLVEIDRFSPHFGGVAANVALVAARAGAAVALAGGAGDDLWGRWLRSRLRDGGVEVSLFELLPGLQTPIAFVTVSAEGEPSYELHGEADRTLGTVLAGKVRAAVDDSAALMFSTNVLVDAGDREVTMAARRRALHLGRPVIFEANLRLHRWRSAAVAAANANACVEGALLVRTNRAEAAAMTGESDPERAAAALLAAGARLVVLSLGADGAILRGEVRADAPGECADVVNTAGAGDVLTGTLLAALALDAFAPRAAADALPSAVTAAARACERWGAVD
ncbi:MAG TPA: PfkB family carbohydrate kinase [Solirubrobacteraceae bacterium]|nr:PfkB family carbohydrate kinase [Solirubrobacteraceae bacterium]